MNTEIKKENKIMELERKAYEALSASDKSKEAQALRLRYGTLQAAHGSCASNGLSDLISGANDCAKANPIKS